MLLLVVTSLPKTSVDIILLQRAARLRQLTDRLDLKSESELEQAQISARQIAFDSLVKP
jgi:DHA1 family multidrug resistance protein-like MFS transporter